MARDDPQMKLRLPEDLRDRIAQAAREQGRSMNAEILQTLEMSYPPTPPAEELIKLISDALLMSNMGKNKSAWNSIHILLSEFKNRLEQEQKKGK